MGARSSRPGANNLHKHHPQKILSGKCLTRRNISFGWSKKYQDETSILKVSVFLFLKKSRNLYLHALIKSHKFFVTKCNDIWPDVEGTLSSEGRGQKV